MEELKKSKFSASNISRLLAGGTGKTQQSYILELALQSIGIKDDISTDAMKHGLLNERTAFNLIFEPLGGLWYNQFIPINEYCGASPDFFVGDVPGDIKSPFYIDTYLEQIEKVPTKYYQQVQMQMLASHSDVGILCFYLTAPEVWGKDWEEYPFSLEDRYKIFEYKKDEELQNEILKKVEESEPKKQQLIEMLLGAEELSIEQFFYEQINGGVYRKLKEASNLFNLEQFYRVGDNFYYKKK